MYNPTRRNRNIGTSKQGQGQNNIMSIPYVHNKEFYENLTDYKTIKKTIKEHEFIFVSEHTKPGYEHACSVEDIERIVKQIPNKDYGDLKFFVLRQPKRKEEILSSVWGRLIMSFSFNNESKPAIIIEALDYANRQYTINKKRSVEEQKELERLISDGHKIVDMGKNYSVNYDINSVRRTQLYRTIPHEFGHYVHYRNFLISYSHDQWLSFPTTEKEKVAHSYSERIRKNIESQDAEK